MLKMVFCYGCWVYFVLVTSQFELNSSTPDPEKTKLSLLSVPSTHNAFNGIVLYNHQSLHLFHFKQILSLGSQQTCEVFRDAAINVAQIT